MYKVEKLFLQNQNKTLQSWLPTEITPEELRLKTDLNIHTYMKVSHSINLEYSILDLSLMFLETKLGRCDTWINVNNILTDELVLGYRLYHYPIAQDQDIIKNQLTTFDVLSEYHNERLHASYTSILSPNVRDNKYRVFDLPDLVISKDTYNDQYEDIKNALNQLDFTKVLPIVNGRFTRSLYDSTKDELYIKNGAKLCRNISIERHIHPDILLLDTTRFNGFTIVPLSICEFSFNKQINALATDFNSLATVTLPSVINLNNTVPWLVLNGIPYFNKELNIVNSNTVEFYPNRTLLKDSYIMHKWLINQPLIHTNIFEIQNTLNEILHSEIKNEDLSFFILFNTPNMFIHESICVPFIDFHTVMIHHFNHGLLYKKNTHGFKGYTYQLFTDGSAMLYMKDPGEFYITDEDENKDSFHGFNDFFCVHNDIIKDKAYSQYSLLSFTSEQIFA
jgi:hypothetical protein